MSAEQWKCGNEFLPYHHQASHVNPDHRDGWNACYRAAQSALQAKDAEIAALKEDAARLDHLQNRGATVEILPDGSWWTFRIGGHHSAQSPNIRAAIDSARALAGQEGKR